MRIKKLREYGELIGRKGLAEEVIRLCEEVVNDGSYKGAMEAAGKIALLAKAATYDQYWHEQVFRGECKKSDDIEFALSQIENINVK